MPCSAAASARWAIRRDPKPSPWSSSATLTPTSADPESDVAMNWAPPTTCSGAEPVRARRVSWSSWSISTAERAVSPMSSETPQKRKRRDSGESASK